MKSVIVIYIVAIIAVVSGIVYMNASLGNIQHEQYTIDAAQESAPIILHTQPTNLVMGDELQGVSETDEYLQPATVSIQ